MENSFKTLDKKIFPRQLHDSSTQSCLFTFDHSHIVGSISNGQGHGFLVLLDQVNHPLLLQWSDSTTDDSLALASCLQQVQLHMILQAMSLCLGGGYNNCCPLRALPANHAFVVFLYFIYNIYVYILGGWGKRKTPHCVFYIPCVLTSEWPLRTMPNGGPIGSAIES